MDYRHKTRLYSHVLICGALIYFVAQWLGASTMSGSKIFSSSAQADRVNFEDMVYQLSRVTRGHCTSGTQRQILFGDHDVVTPYMKEIASGFGQCEVVRATVVTPFTPAETGNCNNLLVTEMTPPGRKDVNRSTEIKAGGEAYGWVERDRWMSSDGRYGFTIYQRPCATL